MSAKPGQSSELRDVLARIQNAKSNRTNAHRRLTRAKEGLEKAQSDVAAADAELKDAEGLLMNALRKGMSGMLKDRDLALAIAETIANNMDGIQSDGGQASLPLADGDGSDGPAGAKQEPVVQKTPVAEPKPSTAPVAPAAPAAAPKAADGSASEGEDADESEGEGTAVREPSNAADAA